MSRVGTHFISIASGKGGVGKTSVSVNLAWALAEAGQRVCLLDADLGLSNVDVLLGVSCETTLEQVIFEGLPMERAATRVAPNLQVISGSSGVSRMAELSRAKRRRLIEEFKKLEAYDYVLIDNSPGITAQVVSVCLSSRDVVLVVNPDAGSITDAYALIKVMRENGLWWPPLLLMNRTRSAETARRIFERVKQTAQKHLNLDCGYLGWLPEDPSVTRAAIVQRPAAEAFPDSPFTRAVLRTAGVIRRYSATAKGRVVAGDQFWENSVMRLKSGPKTARPGKDDARSWTRQARELLDGVLTDLDRAAEGLAGCSAIERPKETDRAVAGALDLVRGARARLGRARGGRDPDERKAAEPEKRPGPKAPATALVVCQDQGMLALLSEIVIEAGLRPEAAALDIGLSGLDPSIHDLCLVLWNGPDQDLAEMSSRASKTPVLLIDASYGRLARAAEDMPGITEIIPAPFKVDRVLEAIARQRP